MTREFKDVIASLGGLPETTLGGLVNQSSTNTGSNKVNLLLQEKEAELRLAQAEIAHLKQQVARLQQ